MRVLDIMILYAYMFMHFYENLNSLKTFVSDRGQFTQAKQLVKRLQVKPRATTARSTVPECAREYVLRNDD